MFVNPNDTVPITHEGDVVHIRAKMGLGVKAKVNDELVRIKLDLARIMDTGEVDTAEMRIGAITQSMILLFHNVKKWEGPSFTDEDGKPIPCTRGRIELIDDLDHPLWVKVLAEINQRNQSQTERANKDEAEPDPKDGPSSSELRTDGMPP